MGIFRRTKTSGSLLRTAAGIPTNVGQPVTRWVRQPQICDSLKILCDSLKINCHGGCLIPCHMRNPVTTRDRTDIVTV